MAAAAPGEPARPLWCCGVTAASETGAGTARNETLHGNLEHWGAADGDGTFSLEALLHRQRWEGVPGTG